MEEINCLENPSHSMSPPEAGEGVDLGQPSGFFLLQLGSPAGLLLVDLNTRKLPARRRNTMVIRNQYFLCISAGFVI